ncbi:FAD/NAD(P)-binding protein [Sphingobium sp. CR28]|uniref:FAD/NAD(P)-binding protein n=1 Tax=Sphingobium sp. CR28 TaxID=3400272 RepID=UPI003FEF109D
MPRLIEHVVIIGGGFSGTLQAINLLRHGEARVTLIERASAPGRGLAYGAAHPGHLLNVPASGMSAFPDDPYHFVRWLQQRGIDNAATTFAPRLTYGTYVGDLLANALRGYPDRFVLLHDEAQDVTQHGNGARVHLRSKVIDADVAVLAIGNLAPALPAKMHGLAEGRYVPDPWHSAALDGLGPEDTVLILGTGLTMVDVALSLSARPFSGKVVALSRRGLVPHPHDLSTGPTPPLRERPLYNASKLVRTVRDRANSIGWRGAVDELRPFTRELWLAASPADRRRFLRHLRPWWDVHRHRIAPEVHRRLAAMRASGQLIVRAGNLCAVEERGESAIVSWRPRGSDHTRQLSVQRIVNCTGPLSDVSSTSDPLLLRLVARGSIRPDDLRLGFDVDISARTIDANGNANSWLVAVGPMTRSAFWEIIAVPDIRVQTFALARRLSNAHWIGAEGL